VHLGKECGNWRASYCYILMKHLFTTLVCLMLITACEKKASFSPDEYLHVIDLNKTAPLSEVFERVIPIVLETTKESLIGEINKVIATSEFLIVLDKSIANALFIFKKDGTFVHKLT